MSEQSILPPLPVQDGVEFHGKPLTLLRGQIALVDEDDYAQAIGHTWYLDGNGYVARSEGRKRIYLHRVVMMAQRGELIDHEDRNKLNNQKTNLRRASKAQNAHNSKSHRDGSSRFKGVYRDKERSKWCAEIMSCGKRLRLGRFDSELEAARAYDKAAVIMHGSFANLNFPKDVA